MATLLESEREQMEQNEYKKRKAFEDMKLALELKQSKKRELTDLEKRENEKYMAYIKEMDKREEVVKLVREEKEVAKNKIFERLKDEEDRRRRDQEELENLKRELYIEQAEADARRKARDEAEKKQRQKREMQYAEQQARERKRMMREQ